MDAALKRALMPKITPQAAARMYSQHLTGVAVTTMTLGTLWWTTYMETWSRVMFPEGRE